ncbi:hypothetical protein [Paenibacillus arenilitoris]|nr:hypothetical protein [Paenibacillus arenilitoris]
MSAFCCTKCSRLDDEHFKKGRGVTDCWTGYGGQLGKSSHAP